MPLLAEKLAIMAEKRLLKISIQQSRLLFRKRFQATQIDQGIFVTSKF